MNEPRSYPKDGNFEDVLKDAIEDIIEATRSKYGGFDLALPENAGLKRLVSGLEGYRPYIEYEPQNDRAIFITVMIKGGGSVRYSVSYSMRGDLEMADYLIDRITVKLQPPEAK